MYRFNQVGKSGIGGVYICHVIYNRARCFFIYSDSQDFPVVNWRPRSDLEGTFEADNISPGRAMLLKTINPILCGRH